MLAMLLESTGTRCMLSWMRMNLGRIGGGKLLLSSSRMVRDAYQHLSQIGFGIEAVEFSRADQAVDRRCAYSASICGELVVRTTQGHTSQTAFGSVVADLDAAISYMARQRISAGETRA